MNPMYDLNDGYTRVRYNYNERNEPRACMVTVISGKLLFFGVSRCHINDRVNKSYGRELALQRANDAVSEFPVDQGQQGILMSEDGLMGVVDVNNLNKLRAYFRGIHTFGKRNIGKKLEVEQADGYVDVGYNFDRNIPHNQEFGVDFSGFKTKSETYVDRFMAQETREGEKLAKAKALLKELLAILDTE